jgi:quercetin dioxygenase-like cupin family protein
MGFSIGGCTMNRADTPTSASTAPASATLASGVYDGTAIPMQTTATGQRRAFLRGPTATLDELAMHATTLNPGQRAHAPHRHPHEEMILLKEGTLEAIVNDRTLPMPAGSVLFIAPNDLHGVRNAGVTPATYFVLTWRTPKTAASPSTAPSPRS